MMPKKTPKEQSYKKIKVIQKQKICIPVKQLLGLFSA